MSEQPKDIGAIFKAERERQGLTLDMVHEATKVPIDSLKAIEEGYKVRTLTAFYYKSFVRIYAQHLGLDPQPLLEQISSEPPKKKFEPRVQGPVSRKVQETVSLNLFAGPLRSTPSRKVLKIAGIMAGAVLVIVLGVLAVRKMAATSSSSPKASKTAVPAKAPKTAPAREEGKKVEARPAGEKKTDEKKKVELSKETNASKITEQPVRKETARTVEPVKTAAVESKNAAAPKPLENVIPARAVKDVSVSVRAQNSSFLSVRSDGKPVFVGTLKKGSVESWTASKLIEISGKDIDQLEFEVNGKSVGKLSRRGSVIKKVRITPEGLSVDK